MKPAYRVLMFGARDWDDMRKIKKMLWWSMSEAGSRHAELIVITGGAPGADSLVAAACRAENVHCAVVEALWEHRHASAGPQRNTAMLMLEPHLGIAFHRDITKSKGTKNMVAQAKKAGVPVRVVR